MAEQLTHQPKVKGSSPAATASTRGGFVEHLSPTEVAQQSVTKIISLTIINLVTPKARAKHEPSVQQTGLREGKMAEKVEFFNQDLSWLSIEIYC